MVMKHLFILSLLFLGSAASSRLAGAPPAAKLARGQQVYSDNCSQCHQMDGSGMSDMQPALLDDAAVQGKTGPLIRIILKGAGAIPAERRQNFSNVMPAFNTLTDQQIADVLTYIRHAFGNQASPVSASQVKTLRTEP